MKKAILAVILLMAVLSSKGRVAWYGEQEFEEPVAALKEEGYTVQYIDALDEETLSAYDVLVLCFAEPSPEERDIILAFVEEGGGLLIIYSTATYPEAHDVLSQYGIGDTFSTERDVIFPFLTDETIEELKKRIAASQRGRGRIITVGYDPITFQAVSFLFDVDTIFTLGMDWLCQDWHVEETQKALAAKRMKIIIPVIVIVAVGLAVGYYLYRRRKRPAERLEKKPEKKESDKQGQIRELKAKFVYGELSKDEYQRELEKLERSAK